MGRSVSRPSNAVCVAYTDFDGDEFDWENFEWQFVYNCKQLYPSLEEVENTWIGREDRVLLENQHAQIGMSEYMGCVAFWIVPQYDEYYPAHNGLHEQWCYQIAPKFECTFGTMVRVGGFSDGTSVYRRKE